MCGVLGDLYVAQLFQDGTLLLDGLRRRRWVVAAVRRRSRLVWVCLRLGGRFAGIVALSRPFATRRPWIARWGRWRRRRWRRSGRQQQIVVVLAVVVQVDGVLPLFLQLVCHLHVRPVIRVDVSVGGGPVQRDALPAQQRVGDDDGVPSPVRGIFTEVLRFGSPIVFVVALLRGGRLQELGHLFSQAEAVFARWVCQRVEEAVSVARHLHEAHGSAEVLLCRFARLAPRQLPRRSAAGGCRRWRSCWHCRTRPKQRVFCRRVAIGHQPGRPRAGACCAACDSWSTCSSWIGIFRDLSSEQGRHVSADSRTSLRRVRSSRCAKVKGARI